MWPSNQHVYIWRKQVLLWVNTMNVMVARDARMSLSNVEQFFCHNKIRKLFSFRVTGPWCSSEPLRSRRQTGGIKITLELLVLENLWSAIREWLIFLAKTLCDYTWPRVHCMHQWSWPTLRLSSVCSHGRDVVFVLCWGHIICIVIVMYGCVGESLFFFFFIRIVFCFF